MTAIADLGGDWGNGTSTGIVRRTMADLPTTASGAHIASRLIYLS